MSKCLQPHVILGRTARLPQAHVPALHFLYDTPTLRRYYNEGGSGEDKGPYRKREGYTSYTPRSSGHIEDGRTPPPRDAHSQRPPATYRPDYRNDSGRPSRFPSDSQADEPFRRRRYPDTGTSRFPDNDNDPASRTGGAADPFPNSRTLDRDRDEGPVEHVPFDLPSDIVEPPKPPSPEKTTLSSQERKVFDRLRKLGGDSVGGAGALKPSTIGNELSDQPQSLDDVLDEAMSKIDAERDSDADMDAAADSDEKVSATIQRHIAERKRISALLQGASTDFALWGLLDKEVFAPIAALKLDRTREDSSTPASTSTSTSTSTSSPSPTPTPTPERERRKPSRRQPNQADRDMLMHNFPRLLSNACRTLRSTFPSSPLVFAVLPKIRDMGPSAYALGASTMLYNQVLAHTFNRFNDVDRVNELLEEMEREVVEPDAVTLVLLNRMVTAWGQVRRGLYGEAARVTWGMERMTKELGRLRDSKVQIEATVGKRESRREVSREARRKEHA